MSKQKHQEFLVRSAQRTVAKVSERRKKSSWTEEELGNVRIQTVEPYKRLLVAAGAIGCLLWAHFGSISGGWEVALYILGLLLLSLAAFGVRKTLRGLMDGGLELAAEILPAVLD